MRNDLLCLLFLSLYLVVGCGGSSGDAPALLSLGAQPPAAAITSTTATALLRPAAIQADGRQNVYVLDGFNSTIRRIPSRGSLTSQHLEAGIGGIAVTQSGEIFFNAAGRIKRVVSINQAEEVAVGLSTSERMATDSSGFVYAIQGVSVLKVARDGKLTLLFQAPQASPLTALTVSRDAFFFASSVFIYRWTNDDGVKLVAVNDAHITDLTADAIGNLYFVDIAPGSDPGSVPGTVKKLGTEGQIQLIAGSRIKAGYANGPGPTALFNFPAGIAIGADGTLFVSDMQNNAIRAIDVRGQVSTFAGQAPV